MDITQMQAADAFESGRWFEFTSDCSLKIACADSLQYRKALRKVAEAAQAGALRGVEKDNWTDIETEAYGEAILIDWKGVEKDGAAWPATPENRKWALKNVPQLRQFVNEHARLVALFTRAAVEKQKDALKNV